MPIFGREPAYWLALSSGLIAFISATVAPLTVDQQGVLNAVVAAVFGALTAWALKGEKLVAALVGLFKAVIAATLAFGLSLSPEVQSTAMVVVELVLTGVLVRPNVVAPVPPKAALSAVGRGAV
jgi:nicotinamide riboside transporter PnuC